jgi:hypothetical protein
MNGLRRPATANERRRRLRFVSAKIVLPTAIRLRESAQPRSVIVTWIRAGATEACGTSASRPTPATISPAVSKSRRMSTISAVPARGERVIQLQGDRGGCEQT